MLDIPGGGPFVSDNYGGDRLTGNLEPMYMRNPENYGYHDKDYDSEYYEEWL